MHNKPNLLSTSQMSRGTARGFGPRPARAVVTLPAAAAAFFAAALLLLPAAAAAVAAAPSITPAARAAAWAPDPRCGPLVLPGMSNITLWESLAGQHALAFVSDSMVVLANPGKDGIVIYDGSIYAFHPPAGLEVCRVHAARLAGSARAASAQ